MVDGGGEKRSTVMRLSAAFRQARERAISDASAGRAYRAMDVTGGTAPSTVWTRLSRTDFVVPIDPASSDVGPHVRVGAD